MTKIFVHTPNKTIRLRPDTENPAAGEVLVGTFNHAHADDDGRGWGPGHVLYHHVEEAMIKAKLFDYAKYDITTVIPVKRVNFNVKEDVELEVGETYQTTATVYPEDADFKTITYATSDNAKASVSNTGLVTAKAAGTVQISGTAGGVTEDITVVVTAAG